jgi:hypothetical protein
MRVNPEKLKVSGKDTTKFRFSAKQFGCVMANEKASEPVPDDVAQFSGAMDDLVAKYDEIISDFTKILDQQTKRIFEDPKLEDQE